MCASVWRVLGFLVTHKWKTLFVSGTAAFVGYDMYREAKRENLRKQLVQETMRKYFENAQKNADNTCARFLSFLDNNIRDAVRYQNTLQEIKDSSTNGQAKEALWHRLKLGAFSHMVTAAIATPLLLLFVRVQVNIIARYLFIDNKKNLKHVPGPPMPKLMTDALQERYLNMVNYFLQTGLFSLLKKIQAASERALNRWELLQPVSLKEVENILKLIRSEFQQDCEEQWVEEFLCPPEIDDPWATRYSTLMENDKLKLLFNETRDTIESSLFSKLAQDMVTKTLSSLLDQLAPVYSSSPSMSMAKLTPQITNVTTTMMNATPSNILASLAANKDLQYFSQYVFEEPLAQIMDS